MRKNRLKRPTVIIGIPAYNEEGSIKRNLDAILKQKRSNITITKIFVYSDASTDKTEEIVRKYKTKLVELVSSKQNLGKTTGIKRLLKRATDLKADILVIVDSDLVINDKYMLNKLTTKIISDKNCIAVSGFVLPLKPKSFIENLSYFGFYLWEKMINSVTENELYFRSSDPLIALRVSDFTQRRIKAFSYMHDEFYYLFAKKYNKTFAFEAKARAYFFMPKNFTDYAYQMRRYMGNHMSKKEKDELKVESIAFSIPERFTAFVICLKDDFKVGIAYLFIQMYIHMLTNLSRQKFRGRWLQVKSTK